MVARLGFIRYKQDCGVVVGSRSFRIKVPKEDLGNQYSKMIVITKLYLVVAFGIVL